jgi:hypothetical protein
MLTCRADWCCSCCWQYEEEEEAGGEEGGRNLPRAFKARSCVKQVHSKAISPTTPCVLCVSFVVAGADFVLRE